MAASGLLVAYGCLVAVACSFWITAADTYGMASIIGSFFKGQRNSRRFPTL
jgi:hypothetical protein